MYVAQKTKRQRGGLWRERKREGEAGRGRSNEEADRRRRAKEGGVDCERLGRRECEAAAPGR